MSRTELTRRTDTDLTRGIVIETLPHGKLFRVPEYYIYLSKVKEQ